MSIKNSLFSCSLFYLSLFLCCSGPVRADFKAGILRAPVTLATTQKESGIRVALKDFSRDFEAALGQTASIADGSDADIVVRIDSSLKGDEKYRLQILPDKVIIIGSDTLGVVYGIYRFSKQFLRVDPFWFWKGVTPVRRQGIELKPQTIESDAPVFRYRGWFINDEDLLSDWKEASGQRTMDYPFYKQVINVDVADRIYETILRSGGNLVIPASFVDVMNPAEAALIERAAQRGLYVTQHHVEPLGVSHFSFESYWKARGKTAQFSYSRRPEQVRETWRAYARKWHELAGERVVWQLGLRGRGDAPVWQDDSGIGQKQAGDYISRAIADQWTIVREVDARPQPPATTTLWAEGSALMSRGELKLPKEVTVVFSDEGTTQVMQDDFHKMARETGRAYGFYYHVAFFSRGAHLVQGVRLAKMKKAFDDAAAKGDTAYAIINVANVREHILGAQAAMQLMQTPQTWSENAFWNEFAPPVMRELYEEFLGAFVDLTPQKMLQDGDVCALSKRFREAIKTGNRDIPAIFKQSNEPYRADIAQVLQESIARFDGIIARYPAVADKAAFTTDQRSFFDVNLLMQVRLQRAFYRHLQALIRATDNPKNVAEAEVALDDALQAREAGEVGVWRNWYRGDSKVNLRQMLRQTQELRKKQGL